MLSHVWFSICPKIAVRRGEGLFSTVSALRHKSCRKRGEGFSRTAQPVRTTSSFLGMFGLIFSNCFHLLPVRIIGFVFVFPSSFLLFAVCLANSCMPVLQLLSAAFNRDHLNHAAEQLLRNSICCCVHFFCMSAASFSALFCHGFGVYLKIVVFFSTSFEMLIKPRTAF